MSILSALYGQLCFQIGMKHSLKKKPPSALRVGGRTPKNQMKTIFLLYYLPLLVCKDAFLTPSTTRVTPLSAVVRPICKPLTAQTDEQASF